MEQAFQSLKTALTSSPVLRNLDFSLPFRVHTQASEMDLGAVKWTVEELHYNLTGHHFTLFTDHTLLQWMSHVKDSNSQVIRWFLSPAKTSRFRSNSVLGSARQHKCPLQEVHTRDSISHCYRLRAGGSTVATYWQHVPPNSAPRRATPVVLKRQRHHPTLCTSISAPPLLWTESAHIARRRALLTLHSWSALITYPP